MVLDSMGPGLSNKKYGGAPVPYLQAAPLYHSWRIEVTAMSLIDIPVEQPELRLICLKQKLANSILQCHRYQCVMAIENTKTFE
ncbi:MAG: hypothetical protein ACRER2_16140 [Methylococcales bacterium]